MRRRRLHGSALQRVVQAVSAAGFEGDAALLWALCTVAVRVARRGPAAWPILMGSARPLQSLEAPEGTTTALRDLHTPGADELPPGWPEGARRVAKALAPDRAMFAASVFVAAAANALGGTTLSPTAPPCPYAGLYARACRAAHSCAANSSWQVQDARAGAVRVRVLDSRGVGAGEEVTFSYIGDEVAKPHAQRRALLAESKFFHCRCARCLAERASGVEWARCWPCRRCEVGLCPAPLRDEGARPGPSGGACEFCDEEGKALAAAEEARWRGQVERHVAAAEASLQQASVAAAARHLRAAWDAARPRFGLPRDAVWRRIGDVGRDVCRAAGRPQDAAAFAAVVARQASDGGGCAFLGAQARGWAEEDRAWHEGRAGPPAEVAMLLDHLSRSGSLPRVQYEVHRSLAPCLGDL